MPLTVNNALWKQATWNCSQTANQQTMYVRLLLSSEIMYQNKGLNLQYRTQVCFHVAYKIHGLWAAQSSEMLLFPLPEGYPNIDAVNGSLQKEVCDMKFKIIVFKFVVSRLGFYHACQTFPSFAVGWLYKYGFHLCIHRRKWWFSHFVGMPLGFSSTARRTLGWFLSQEEGMEYTSAAVLGKGNPGFSGLGVKPLLVPPSNDACLPWPAPAVSRDVFILPPSMASTQENCITSIFLSMGFQMSAIQECSILKCVRRESILSLLKSVRLIYLQWRDQIWAFQSLLSACHLAMSLSPLKTMKWSRAMTGISRTKAHYEGS